MKQGTGMTSGGMAGGQTGGSGMGGSYDNTGYSNTTGTGTGGGMGTGTGMGASSMDHEIYVPLCSKHCFAAITIVQSTPKSLDVSKALLG